MTPSPRFITDVMELLKFERLILKLAQKNDELVEYLELWSQLSYCRIVDRYLIYISEILAALFELHPEMLRSNEMVDLDFVLSHESMEGLVSSIIERKVTTLSFQGMRKVAGYFERRLKLPLFSNEEELETGVAAVEIRNLFTHNQGVVNRLFKERVPGFKCEVGQQIKLVGSDVASVHTNILLDSVKSLAQRIVDKFQVAL
jgi:hypothetical protein